MFRYLLLIILAHVCIHDYVYCENEDQSLYKTKISSRIAIPQNKIQETLSIPTDYESLLKYDIRNVANQSECGEPQNEPEMVAEESDSFVIPGSVCGSGEIEVDSNTVARVSSPVTSTTTTTTICIPCPTVHITTSTLTPMTITTHWTVTTTVPTVQDCITTTSATITSITSTNIPGSEPSRDCDALAQALVSLAMLMNQTAAIEPMDTPCNVDWYMPPLPPPPYYTCNSEVNPKNNIISEVETITSTVTEPSISTIVSTSVCTCTEISTSTLVSIIMQRPTTIVETEAFTVTRNITQTETQTTKAWFPVVTTETQHVTHTLTTPVTISQILPITICSPYPVTLTVNNTLTSISTETISSTFPPVVLTETQVSIATVPYPVIQTEFHTLPPVVETVTDTVTEYSTEPCKTIVTSTTTSTTASAIIIPTRYYPTVLPAQPTYIQVIPPPPA
jgi:hypothetical protein